MEKYQRPLASSSLSVILSDTYERLDSGLANPEGTKAHTPYWPDLELALFKWQIAKLRKGAMITGDLLKVMAEAFWEKLPQYKDLPKPKVSTGWLDGYKSRHQIKKWVRHGETAGVDHEAVEGELKDL